jgi:hypothetical protein
MAIYRLLQNSAFGPEDIERMTAAYEKALVTLKLANREDPITETIAKRIIAATQRGVKDPEALCASAMKDIGVPKEL